jgi:hypothetical protein
LFNQLTIKLRLYMFLKEIDSWTKTEQTQCPCGLAAVRTGKKRLTESDSFLTNPLLKEFFMDETIKLWWLDVSEARLRDVLVAKKLPSAIAGQLVARVQEMKAERRKARIKATTVANSWEALLAAARAERQTVYVRKTHAKKKVPPDQRKWEALCAYETAITAVIERLRKVQGSSEHTPKQFVAYLKEETGRVVPNGGEHWTDFVKASERRQVTLMFDALPPPGRGRRKQPFERRMTKPQHKAQSFALAAELVNSIASAEREYEVTTDPEAQDRLNRQLDDMYRAQHVLDSNPPAVLPRTWHGLIK